MELMGCKRETNCLLVVKFFLVLIPTSCSERPPGFKVPMHQIKVEKFKLVFSFVFQLPHIIFQKG